MRIEEFDLPPIQFVESARGNPVCGIPSLRLDAAEAIGVAHRSRTWARRTDFAWW